MMNCEQATRLLSDARERKLSVRERIAIRWHILICSSCRIFGIQVNDLGRLSQRYAKGRDKPVAGQSDGSPDPKNTD